MLPEPPHKDPRVYPTALQFLTNMLFARFINKELISRQTMLAMGLVVAGAVLMVSFGNHESPISTGHELLHFYST